MTLRSVTRNSPLPLHHQLRKIIEDGILLGDLRPGEKLFSERKICELFNVSRPIVIKVLNDLADLGLLIRKHGSGTYINNNAPAILKKQGEKPSKTLVIGIGFLDSHRREDPKTIKILNAVQNICDELGVSNRLLGASNHISWESSGDDIDGVLVIDETRAGDVYNLEDKKIPFVSLFAKYEGKNYPVVMNNPIKIGKISTQYFVSKGHKRIAYITGPLKRQPGCCLAFSPQMIEGYRQVLKKNRIRYSAKLIKNCQNYKESEAYEAMLQLMELPDPPTAVISFDDMLAMGAMRAIHEKGIRVPNDIAIMGSGDILDSDFLSTLDMNISKVAITAFNMLMRLIHHQPIPKKNLIVDFNLIIRKSSG